MKVARIYIKQTNKRLDHPYDYHVPEQLEAAIRPGVRVAVLFGRWRREVEGFVTAVSDATEFEGALRDVRYAIDEAPVLFAPQIALCVYLKDRYHCLFYEALALFVSPVKVSRKIFDKATKEKRFMPYHKLVKAKAEEKAPDLTAADDANAENFLKRVAGVPQETPLIYTEADAETRFNAILALAARYLSENKRVLIVVPEIAGTVKAQSRFHKVCGDRGAVFHSGLTAAKRYAVFTGVQNGAVDVVMGTRAALFLPFETLDLIVVDEAGSPLYVSDSEPHYHTAEIAAFYRTRFGAKLMIADFMPSVRSTALLAAHKAVSVSDSEKQPLTKPVICDMGAELKSGNLSFISRDLKAAINAALDSQQKVVLLHNRLGYASYVFCRDCGHTAHCPTCDSVLKTDGRGGLVCPVCGFCEKLPNRCPKCGSRRYRGMGLGVAQVYDKMRAAYPDKKTVLVTAKTVREAGFRKMNKAVAAADIIVGTQALCTHFSFDNVGVSAVVLIDAALNENAYDATAQAYRDARAFFALGGMSYLQTYHPEHPVVRALSAADDSAFFKEELGYRRLMHYPPYGHLFVYQLFDADDKMLMDSAARLYKLLDSAAGSIGAAVYTPVRRFSREKGVTCRIVMKCDDLDAAGRVMRLLIESGRWEAIPAKISYEIDPVNH